MARLPAAVIAFATATAGGGRTVRPLLDRWTTGEAGGAAADGACEVDCEGAGSGCSLAGGPSLVAACVTVDVNGLREGGSLSGELWVTADVVPLPDVVSTLAEACAIYGLVLRDGIREGRAEEPVASSRIGACLIGDTGGGADLMGEGTVVAVVEDCHRLEGFRGVAKIDVFGDEKGSVM